MEKKSGFKSVNAANAANVVPFGQNQKPVELYDLEIEQMILGEILSDNLKFEQAAAFITADSFYFTAHGKIWDEIKKKIDNAEKASIVSLNPIFKDCEELKEHGGVQYLVGLISDLIAPDVEECAKIIRDFALRRVMLSAVEAAADSIKSNPSIFQSLQPLEIAIHKAVESTGDTIAIPSETWLATMKRIEGTRNGEIVVQRTGFKPIDDVLGGLQQGCLYILAGATGMGKTAMGLNIANNVADEGSVLFFSIEMSHPQLLKRLAAEETGVAVTRQNVATDLTDAEMRALASFRPKDRMRVVHNGKDLSTIANISKKFVRKFGDARLIVIDYLQLLDGDQKIPQRVYQIEQITRGLKRLAALLNIPIILLSQLSRSVSGREDKRPILSDLKDAGSIEQDADAVLFVYRHDYYLSREEPQRKAGDEGGSGYQQRLCAWQQQLEDARGRAEIILAKNRYGETGTAHMAWDGRRQKFSDPAKSNLNQDSFF